MVVKKSVLILAILVSSLAFAQANKSVVEILEADMVEQNQLSEAVQSGSSQSTSSFFKEYAKKNNISYGIKKDGKLFLTGEADVILKPTDPEFGKTVVLAYEKAILELQKEYVMDNFGNIASDRFVDFYQDNSTNARLFDESIKSESKIANVVDKALTFASVKLDEWLEEMGVSGKNLTEKEKKSLFKQEYVKSVIKQANKSMSGLVPIQTHIAYDKKGNYTVGVIAIVSDKTEQLARDMSLNRKPIISGNGRELRDFIPQKDEEYLNELGIRMVYNEKGEPCILSYGRWSYVENSNDDYINKATVRSAKNQAKNQADAMIIEFINTNLSTQTDSKYGELVENILTKEIQLKDGGDTITEDNVKNIIDKFSSQIKANSKGNMGGIGTLEDWEFVDENGIGHVGYVRVWTYANVEARNELLKQKRDVSSKNVSKTTGGKNKSLTSREVNTPDDF